MLLVERVCLGCFRIGRSAGAALARVGLERLLLDIHVGCLWIGRRAIGLRCDARLAILLDDVPVRRRLGPLVIRAGSHVTVLPGVGVCGNAGCS